jgi:hypothetical protein
MLAASAARRWPRIPSASRSIASVAKGERFSGSC